MCKRREASNAAGDGEGGAIPEARVTLRSCEKDRAGSVLSRSLVGRMV